MIRSHRAVVVPALGASLATHALLHPRYRLHAVENRRVVSEDGLLMPAFDRRGYVGRPIVTVLLSGSARISAHGRRAWLAPGDVLAMDAKDAIRMRQEGDPYRALAFEWDPGFLGGRPEPFGHGRVEGEPLRAMGDLFDRIAGDAGRPADVVQVAQALREAGLDLSVPSEAECEEEVSPETVALSETLDRLLSRLDEQPMIADLETRLGISPRQVNRRVAVFHARYGFNAGGWQDARRRRRLFMGATLMTAPGATGELIARAVGYRALSAFTHALTEAGLPPPSAIPGVVVSLREGEPPGGRGGSHERQRWRRPAAAVRETIMETYEIKGMTCQHCVRAVEKALAKVPGVTAVRSVDLDRGRAVVDGAPDEQAVIAAVKAEGYEARRAG